MPEWRPIKPGARFGTGLLLDRFEVGAGVDVWIADGHATSGFRAGVSTDRVEAFVTLAGELTQASGRGGVQTPKPGRMATLSPGEPYSLHYAARGHLLAIGLTLDPAAMIAPERDRELRIADPTVDRDAALRDLLEHLARQRALGLALPAEDVTALAQTFVRRHCELSAPDPLVRARHLIEDGCEHELYLRHLAAEVGMAEFQFLRRFTERYGVTPIRYRAQVRLTRAGRLAWMSPALPIGEIARRVGVSNLSYFHRSYRRYFGATPAAHRRGLGADLVGAVGP